MSEATKAALMQAINDHVADECDGDLVGAFVVVAETTNTDEMTDEVSSFYTVTRSYQSNFTTTGLMYRALESGSFDRD